MWRYAVLTAHQPGARHAPLHFLSGGLFSKDINDLYERLALPVWMSHGTRGDFVDYRAKSTVEGRPNWRFSVFEAGALPYFEKPHEFCAAYDDFLRAAGPSLS
jgi:pimeloyl-ACP methyl ester carboxylesterase